MSGSSDDLEDLLEDEDQRCLLPICTRKIATGLQVPSEDDVVDDSIQEFQNSSPENCHTTKDASVPENPQDFPQETLSESDTEKPILSLSKSSTQEDLDELYSREGLKNLKGLRQNQGATHPSRVSHAQKDQFQNRVGENHAHFWAGFLFALAMCNKAGLKLGSSQVNIQGAGAIETQPGMNQSTPPTSPPAPPAFVENLPPEQVPPPVVFLPVQPIVSAHTQPAAPLVPSPVAVPALAPELPIRDALYVLQAQQLELGIRNRQAVSNCTIQGVPVYSIPYISSKVRLFDDPEVNEEADIKQVGYESNQNAEEMAAKEAAEKAAADRAASERDARARRKAEKKALKEIKEKAEAKVIEKKVLDHEEAVAPVADWKARDSLVLCSLIITTTNRENDPVPLSSFFQLCADVRALIFYLYTIIGQQGKRTFKNYSRTAKKLFPLGRCDKFQLLNPLSIAVHPLQSFFVVANTGLHQLIVFASNGIALFGLVEGLLDPICIRFDVLGRLVVLEKKGQSIKIFGISLLERTFRFVSSFSTQLWDPSHVACWHGGLALSDTKEWRVVLVNYYGNVLRAFGCSGPPGAMAFDQDSLLVSEETYHGPMIRKINADNGKEIECFKMPKSITDITIVENGVMINAKSTIYLHDETMKNKLLELNSPANVCCLDDHGIIFPTEKNLWIREEET